ncbi:hypothetical protein BDV25DRAFT_67492 [Aspergillus avenaceus]|uniref:Chromo domain-containing protein n=1 Tax=Aspergillus avenaceus TaxID=36643 RepID=A0A5N6U2G4_ASPAV|nr:hypothetical protein BDV25DRAFT_67492 [Aspergillus avenaceus]
MAEDSDDSISVTSTVPSPPKDNYFVDTILAERRTSQGTEYLVGWEDYPIERSTWETAAQFDDEQTLFDWADKKRAIAAGTLPAFDLTAFYRRIREDAEARADRKNRRRIKRQKLVRKGLRESISDTSARHHGSVADPKERGGPCSERSGTCTDRGTSNTRLVVGRLHPSRVALARPPPVGFGSGPGGRIRARPKRPHDVDPSAVPTSFRTLSTKHKYEKAKNYEPEPDINQLELIRPSEWHTSPATNLVKVGFQHIRDHPAEEPNGDETNGGDSPNRGTPRPVHSSATVPDSPAHTSSGTASPHHVYKSSTGVPQLPDRKPDPGARWVKPNRFANQGELVASLYYGPDKKEIGETRLCGLDGETRNHFMKTKRGGPRLEVWFQNLCSLPDYKTLCKNTRNQFYWNGWVEGYNDTEPDVYEFARELRQRKLVAISYLNTREQDVLLGYPPDSEDFRFLDGDFQGPPHVFLHTALRNILGPIERIWFNKSKGYGENPQKEIAAPVDPSQNKAACDTEKVSELAGEPALTPARTSASRHAFKPSISTPFTPLSGANTITIQTAKRPTTQPSSRRLSMSSNGDAMDIDQPSKVFTPANGSDKVQLPSAVEFPFDFDGFFKEKFGITFENLAKVTGDSRIAGSFCVLFPRDSEGKEEECQLLLEYLKSHNTGKHKVIIYSNRIPDDWEKFKQAKNGVALIHESYLDFYRMRGLYQLCRQVTFNFWSFALSREEGDCQPYFQRMFGAGAVTLITEDFMVNEPKATLIILKWFKDYAKARFPGTHKLMLRPDILNWLEKKVESTGSSRYLWLAMYHLILQITTIGDATLGDILTGAESGFTASTVISPAVPLYGSRPEDDNPEIPKSLTQSQRDSDHLIEFFAGWALFNCYQFRKFYVCTCVGPLPRWEDWQHLQIKVGMADILKTFNLDYATNWDMLKKSMSKQGSSTELKPQTPLTPRTPRASLSKGPQTPRGKSSLIPPLKHSYPQPYN